MATAAPIDQPEAEGKRASARFSGGRSKPEAGDLTELRSADAYCRYLTRRHYENFSVVSAFLPRTTRTHLARIYAFCRTTDDFGDESNGRGLTRLAVWREELLDCFSADAAPIHPVLIALSVTIRQVGLPSEPFLELIQANIQDQTVGSYESWEDLRGYCRLSAAPVGRMVLRIFGVTDVRAFSLSDDVCIGLQLANHAQDVRRDSLRGRNYLVQSIVRDHGVEGGVRDLVERAEQLLASGVELERVVPRRLKAQLSLYRRGGLEVAKAIRSLDYRTDVTRPTVSRVAKLALVAKTIGECVA